MSSKAIGTLLLAVSLMVSGCGSAADVSPTPSSKQEASSSAADSSAVPSAVELASSKEEEKYFFKDNILKIEDATVKITDYKVIQAGEEGNEYGEKPVIAFWYTTTNDSDDFIDAVTAWIACFTAIQDNDPNIVNELNVGSLPDKRFLDTQLADIKPGGTLENAIAYELSDLETPVTLRATKGSFGQELGSQQFEIK